jgi:hypothetical protein
MAEFGALVALPFRMFTEITEGQREGGGTLKEVKKLNDRHFLIAA